MYLVRSRGTIQLHGNTQQVNALLRAPGHISATEWKQENIN